jgi:hypothetical protein
VGLGEGHAGRGATSGEGARVRVQGTEAREAAEQEHGSRLEKLAMAALIHLEGCCILVQRTMPYKMKSLLIILSFGSHLHCCSNILGFATELQIDQKGVMFAVLCLSNTVVIGFKKNRTLTMLNRD